jgi:N-methylhydantoinase B/oxoprolinase/acetone carboxylase alpha subunit
VTDPVRLEIFKHLFASVAEEMGVTLGRTGYSPNIKERLDIRARCSRETGGCSRRPRTSPFSRRDARLCPAAIDHCAPFAPGDVVILNDPYLGGTHLPDITMVSPVFILGGGELAWGGDKPALLHSRLPRSPRPIGGCPRLDAARRRFIRKA